MNTRDKAEALEYALRRERNQLREIGGSDNVRLSNDLNTYIQRADEDSKARIYDSLCGDVVQRRAA